MKLYEIWTSDSVVQRELLSRALVVWNHLCNFGRRYHEEQPCEIIMNFDNLFRRKSCFKLFLIWSSGSPFVQRSITICAILVVYYEDQFCEIILILGQWFRTWHSKEFLSGALAALLFSGAEPFMH